MNPISTIFSLPLPITYSSQKAKADRDTSCRLLHPLA